MTGSTAATAGGHGNGAEHQHHSHGPISALKGVFANRPSSRDRRGGAPEDGMERISSGHRQSFLTLIAATISDRQSGKTLLTAPHDVDRSQLIPTQTAVGGSGRAAWLVGLWFA